MDEPVRKKTILAWQPPAAAARRGDDTLIAPAAPPPPSATLIAPMAPATCDAAPEPEPEPGPAAQPTPADLDAVGHTLVRPTEHAAPAHAAAHAATQEATRAVATPETRSDTAPAAAQAAGPRVRSQVRAVAPAVTQDATPYVHGDELVLAPGDIIGERYVIKDLAGEGGFAAVYRAADSEIPNHEVAVKLLKASADDVQARAAALRELTLIAAVSHPSVVQFKDYGWHEGHLFFAMPWYRGRTLASSSLPLDRASARRIFERCAYGLQAMHEAGICHYDIKPDNIFLANIAGFEAGFPVLLDLGIAAKRGETPMALTPEYASPETASAILNGGDTPVGTAADVYSLALSLRNVLEPDTAPSFGASIPVFLHQRTREPVPPPSSKELRYLKPYFERWLSIEPSERPSAAEFAVELAALTQPEEQRAERKRMLLRAAPILLVLALAITGLGYALKTKTKELVLQKAVAAKEGAATSARLAELKRENQDQRNDALQVAQDLETQRDDFKKQRDQTREALSSTKKERDRVRADLARRTRERDQTRDDLQKLNGDLDQTRIDLEQRTQDLEARTRDVAQARADLTQARSDFTQARADLAERSQELAARTAERDRTQGELTRQNAALEAQASRLDATARELERRTNERDRLADDLVKREKELQQAQDALARRNKELDAVELEQRKLQSQIAKLTQERDDAMNGARRRAVKSAVPIAPAAR